MIKGRADGEGSIYQDGDYWIAAMATTDPATGQRRRRKVKRKTKKDALAALRDMQGRKSADQPLRDSVVTLGSWSLRWEATVLPASRRRRSTQSTYRTLSKTCIRPHLGGVPLARLRISDVEGWLLTLAKSGRAASTRRQSHTILRALLDDAVRDGLLARNVAAQVPRPRVPRVEAEYYQQDAVAALQRAAAGHRLAIMLTVFLGTGMRRGEVLALKRANVDRGRRELRVRGTLVRVDGKLTVHEPKTGNGWRTIPLSPSVLAALDIQRRQQLAERMKAGPSWIATDYVFTTEAGTPLDPRNVSRWFTGLTKAAQVGGSLHTLRHTALTTMAMGGAPLSVLSRIAGHDSIATTIDLYGHVSEQAAREAMLVAETGLGLVEPRVGK